MKTKFTATTTWSITATIISCFVPSIGARKVLIAPIATRLKVLIQECVEKWHQEFVEVEVMPDHVHLIVGCDPQFGIHKLVRLIKGPSSHCLRITFPELKRKLPSLWTSSYYVGTSGGVTIETVKRYVESQKGK